VGRSARRFGWIASLACVAGLAVAAPPASAIDFVLVYDDLGENPSFDPNGTQLMAIAEAAAQRWERLIDSPGTHEVDVSWSNLDPGQLGLWKFDLFGNNNLYFDADSTDWFLDSSPHGDSEYDFGDPLEFFDGPGSELVVSDPDSFLYFDQADPPETLETAYFGNGVSGEAADDYDLLSVVMHEMGHELGIAGDEFSGRYAIYSFHVNGVQDLEVIEENREGSNMGEEHGHLAPPDALMSPNTAPGVRVLPSATDVLAAARDSGYVEVDLVRKFSGVDGAYDEPLVWIGGAVPDSADDVLIVHGGTITVDSAETARSVSIGRNSTLAFTGGADLTIDEELRVDDFANVSIPFGSVLSADLLLTEQGSDVTLAGGELAVTSGGVEEGARIDGRGRLTMNGGFLVEGSVRAEGGDLRLTGPGFLGLIDGELRATDGNLGMELPFGFGSAGEIVVGAGRSFSALADLSIPSGVQLTLLGSPSDPSIVSSFGTDVELTIHNLDVGQSGGGDSAAEITARNVTLANTVNVFGDLTLSSLRTDVPGGASIFGSGRVIQDGPIAVRGGGTASISVDTFDWGNSTESENQYVIVGPNTTLAITSDSLGSASNGFRGTLQVDSGVLDIQGLDAGSWSLSPEFTFGSTTLPGGLLDLAHNGAADPVVRGDAFTTNHLVLVSGGDARIEADLTVTQFADIFVFPGARLLLEGTTTIAGGTWGGDTILQSGDIDVTADVTMSVDEFNWGNSTMLSRNGLRVGPGATFTVDSPTTGDPENDYRGHVVLDGGELVVNTTAGWTLPRGELFQSPGTLEMIGGGLVPRIAGQDLTIEDDVIVTGGLARIDANASFADTSSVDIDAGATLELTGSNVYRGEFVGDGTVRHEGTALLGTLPVLASNFVQAGEITTFGFGGESQIATQTLRFESGSETTLFGDLRIRGITTVEDGSLWNGDGDLIVDDRARLQGSAVVGVDVINEGVVAPGASPGILTVDGDYTQTGLLRIELGGTQPVVEHDVLSILGHAALGGVLEMLLTDGFLPAPGDDFEILRFSSAGVSGAFDELDLPDLGGNGYWDMSALYSAGRATFVPEPGTFALVAIGLAALRSRRAHSKLAPT